MTQHEVITQIRDAITEGNLSAAEKALGEYVISFEEWRVKKSFESIFFPINNNTERDFSDTTPFQKYKLFIKQNEKSLNKQ